ncbi:dNA polymerase III delta subunit [Clostridium sp. CAG:1000]|nr:dNA polymerase III delta subunit [Clostridium sp. CAG:1000]
MIYVFLGNEINLLKRRIDGLKHELNINNIIEYDFDDSNIIDILNEANYVDLFNEKKLIIVSNFSFKKVKDAFEKELLRYIDNMNDNVIILKCIDESLDERKNITKKLREKCKVEEIKKMDYKELHEYITNMFVSNNKKITYNQVKEILNRCEYNDDLAINETEKLLLYKIGEDVITDDDIDKVVSKSSEKEIFTLSDAVMKKNLKQIFNSYNILIRSGIEPVVLIDNLARQFRTLYQVKILCKTMDEKEISRKLGLNPYVVKKAHENVNNYEEEELINNLYELSNLDIDIKVKGLDKYKVLENFFLKI